MSCYHNVDRWGSKFPEKVVQINEKESPVWCAECGAYSPIGRDDWILARSYLRSLVTVADKPRSYLRKITGWITTKIRTPTDKQILG